MPRTSRRKRSLSSGDENSVTYYSKHRCVDREYSPAPESRHVKHYSSRSRSRERRRRHRHSSRNRSHSTRRSDRKLRRQKHRNELTAVSTVRAILVVFFGRSIQSVFRYKFGIKDLDTLIPCKLRTHSGDELNFTELKTFLGFKRVAKRQMPTLRINVKKVRVSCREIANRSGFQSCRDVTHHHRCRFLLK